MPGIEDLIALFRPPAPPESNLRYDLSRPYGELPADLSGLQYATQRSSVLSQQQESQRWQQLLADYEEAQKSQEEAEQQRVAEERYPGVVFPWMEGYDPQVGGLGNAGVAPPPQDMLSAGTSQGPNIPQVGAGPLPFNANQGPSTYGGWGESWSEASGMPGSANSGVVAPGSQGSVQTTLPDTLFGQSEAVGDGPANIPSDDQEASVPTSAPYGPGAPYGQSSADYFQQGAATSAAAAAAAQPDNLRDALKGQTYSRALDIVAGWQGLEDSQRKQIHDYLGSKYASAKSAQTGFFKQEPPVDDAVLSQIPWEEVKGSGVTALNIKEGAATSATPQKPGDWSTQSRGGLFQVLAPAPPPPSADFDVDADQTLQGLNPRQAALAVRNGEGQFAYVSVAEREALAKYIETLNQSQTINPDSFAKYTGSIHAQPTPQVPPDVWSQIKQAIGLTGSVRDTGAK